MWLFIGVIGMPYLFCANMKLSLWTSQMRKNTKQSCVNEAKWNYLVSFWPSRDWLFRWLGRQGLWLDYLTGCHSRMKDNIQFKTFNIYSKYNRLHAKIQKYRLSRLVILFIILHMSAESVWHILVSQRRYQANITLHKFMFNFVSCFI